LRLFRDRFYVHLLWFMTLGVAWLFWIGKFTEQLEDVLTLLAMGGVAGWVAFVANLIRARRKDHLQLLLDGFMAHGISSVLATLATLAFLFWGSTHGTVVLDASFLTDGRRVRVGSAGKPEEHGEVFRLGAGAEKRVACRTAIGGHPYAIDIDGLPLLEVAVRPWRRSFVEVPGDLLVRNSVLIRPSMQLAGTLAKGTFQLTASLGTNGLGTNLWRGESVWIGCRGSVEVPAKYRQAWREELAGLRGPSRILDRWLSPKALGPPRALVAGQDLNLAVLRADGSVFLEVRRTIVECRSPSEFPQLVEIEIQ
jgi:hypothetical protein